MSGKTYFDNAMEFAKLNCFDEKKNMFCLSQGNCQKCREHEFEIIEDAHHSDIEHVRKEEYHRGFSDGESRRETSTWQIDEERRIAASEIRKIGSDSGGFVKSLAKALSIEWQGYRVNQTIAAIRDRLSYLMVGGYEQVEQEPCADSRSQIDEELDENAVALSECEMYRRMLNQARDEFMQLRESYLMAQDERRSLEQKVYDSSPFIALPKDENGNAVNIGDVVMAQDGRTMKVIGIKPKGFFWIDGSYEDHPHIKQRGSNKVRVVPEKKHSGETIESLIREAFNEGKLAAYGDEPEYHEGVMDAIVAIAETLYAKR